MNEAIMHVGSAAALLAELQRADHIIKAMLNAMTTRQKSKVHEQLDKAGVSGEGMTRANERRAVIEAATAAPVSASIRTTSQRMLGIEGQARRPARAWAPVALAPASDELKLSEVEKRIVLAHRKLDRETQADLMHVMQAWANDPRFCAKARPSLRLIAGGAS